MPNMAQVWQIYARHAEFCCTPADRRPPALRTPPASLFISTLPRPPPAALGTVLLHSAHIIHACPAIPSSGGSTPFSVKCGSGHFPPKFGAGFPASQAYIRAYHPPKPATPLPYLYVFGGG